MGEISERKHPIYWFEDGSIIIDVEIYEFKVHHTLVSRHSRFFSALYPTKKVSGDPQTQNWVLHKPTPLGSQLLSEKRVVLHAQMRISANDVEALLQHLYHDVPLNKDSPFEHVASLFRVSSQSQLDYPAIHKSAREILEGMFPSDPVSFTHEHPLHEALPLVTEYNLKAPRKAILYSLIATTEFDISEPESTTQIPHLDTVTTSPPQTTTTTTPSKLTLSLSDSQICTDLMQRIIDYFSPTLFTAPAASHMTCTDLFAETWMTLVISPALQDDGVYRPLETLARIKAIDWEGKGLCASCAAEKREEWTEEQRVVWGLIDDWIEAR